MTLTKKLNVTKLHISSEVQCRFATTEINSRVENVSGNPEEAEFVANLPEGAFITYFEMEIDGKVIVGDVKEKEQAKQVYNAAKSRGETAGHVAQAARETNTFNISVNIAQYSFARFKLVYQELLQRVRGAYKHQINVHPGQTVEDLQVNVTIKENNPITILHVPTFAAKLSDKSCKELLLLKQASDIQIDRVSNSEMTVKWHPSAVNQSIYLTDDVLDGQLIVLYDVDRKDDQVLVVDGHFIHFLAPKNLEIGSKNIVFALDISGSMGDGKLEQTKTAMRSILNQLRPTDQFSILCFDTALEVWKKKPVLATTKNVSEAIGFVDAQQPRGGTDIDLAVQEGIKWLKTIHSEHLLASILVLLTDGQHNSGQFSSHQITPRVKSSLRDGGQSIKIYGLGFGVGADFNLLREMSTKTGGFARKIYAASDAAVQLDSFYAEISSPLLADLNIKYINPNVEVVSTVQNNHGDTLFVGSEFVIIGKMNQLSLNDGEEIFEWHARSCRGPRIYKCCYRPWQILPRSNKGEIAKTAGSFIERSWAYLTIKNLLEKAKIDSDESAALKKQALQLALRYKFVTELTSMVVTQAQNVHELDLMELDVVNPFSAKAAKREQIGSHFIATKCLSTGLPSRPVMKSFGASMPSSCRGGPTGYDSNGFGGSHILARTCSSTSQRFEPTPGGRAPRSYCSPSVGFGGKQSGQRDDYRSSRSRISAPPPPPSMQYTRRRSNMSSNQYSMSSYQPTAPSYSSNSMPSYQPTSPSYSPNRPQSKECGLYDSDDLMGSSELFSTVNQKKEKRLPSDNRSSMWNGSKTTSGKSDSDDSSANELEGGQVDAITNIHAKRQQITGKKAYAQLASFVGVEADKLEEMCEDQPPTLIEKLINTPIDQVIGVVTKLIGTSDTTTKDGKSKEICLLTLVATLIASKLPSTKSVEDMIKLLFDKTTNETYVIVNGSHQFSVECSAGQLASATSILLAIQTMIRINLLCSIKSQNQLVQLLSVAVGSVESGALETLAKQIIAAIDA